MKPPKLAEKLIQLALKHLKTRSVQDLSLRELAKAAGVSEAAPYRHFKSKEDLLAAISCQAYLLKTKYMLAAEASTDNVEEQLHRIGQAYLKMGMRHPEHFKSMTMCPMKASPDRIELFEAAKNSFFVLLRVVERAQAKKLIGAGDPFHKAMHCWVTVHGFTSLYVDGRLEWLGVNEKNVEAAIRMLTEELVGDMGKPLPKKRGFQIALDPAQKEFLEKLRTQK